jgi:hypothetical protein
MKIFLITLSLLALVTAPITAIAKKKNEVPEYTVEGLKLVPNTKEIALVWAEPGIDLTQYGRVYLVEPIVAFKKNWQRDQNRGTLKKVNTRDMERIKAGVSELFMEVFTEELESGGYVLANERAEDVLIVKPAIVDLYINAPDIQSSSSTRSYSTSAGSMTLYLELSDSETDDLLVKAMDPTYDRDNAFMHWQTGPANRAAAKRMMKPWAQALRGALDEAHASNREENK